MKIKSAVEISYDEVCKLFDIVKDCCLAQYVTLEDQEEAIAVAKDEFETLLNKYVQEAFKLGKKHQKAKILSKTDDTEYPTDQY